MQIFLVYLLSNSQQQLSVILFEKHTCVRSLYGCILVVAYLSKSYIVNPQLTSVYITKKKQNTYNRI